MGDEHKTFREAADRETGAQPLRIKGSPMCWEAGTGPRHPTHRERCPPGWTSTWTANVLSPGWGRNSSTISHLGKETKTINGLNLQYEHDVQWCSPCIITVKFRDIESTVIIRQWWCREGHVTSYLVRVGQQQDLCDSSWRQDGIKCRQLSGGGRLQLHFHHLKNSKII